MNSFENWLQLTNLSTDTISQYASDVQQFMDWLKEYPVERVSKTHLLSFQRHLKELNYSTVTINRKLSAIYKWLQFAKAEGLVSRIPKMPPRLPLDDSFLYLTAQEQERLHRELNRAQSLRDVLLIKLFLVAGLRLSEACKLKRNDIQLTGVPAILLPNRTVPIGPGFAQTAAQYMAEYNTGDLLFSSSNNTTLSRQSVYAIINRYAQSAALGRVSAWVLRNTCIYNLITANVSHDQICVLMDIKKTKLNSILRTLDQEL